MVVIAAKTGLPEEYWLEDDRRMATVLELFAGNEAGPAPDPTRSMSRRVG